MKARKPEKLLIPEDDKKLLDQCTIETMRSSGKGGQHVNRTESAVRITHKPTGISVKSQKYRSQHRNKALCLERLRKKLEKLNQIKKPRIKTLVPESVKEKIKESKKRRSALKRTRKPVRDED